MILRTKGRTVRDFCHTYCFILYIKYAFFFLSPIQIDLDRDELNYTGHGADHIVTIQSNALFFSASFAAAAQNCWKIHGRIQYRRSLFLPLFSSVVVVVVVSLSLSLSLPLHLSSPLFSLKQKSTMKRSKEPTEFWMGESDGAHKYRVSTSKIEIKSSRSIKIKRK